MNKLAIIATFFVVVGCTTTPPASTDSSTSTDSKETSSAEKVTFATANKIIEERCVTCHSATPSDTTFSTAPGNTKLDTPEEIKKMVDRIQKRVVEQKTMPLSNKTKMTQEERDTIANWIEQGAPTE